MLVWLTCKKSLVIHAKEADGELKPVQDTNIHWLLQCAGAGAGGIPLPQKLPSLGITCAGNVGAGLLTGAFVRDGIGRKIFL